MGEDSDEDTPYTKPYIDDDKKKLNELYSPFEQMLLEIYSNALDNQQSIESLDNMDFLYFLDILIYNKLTRKNEKKEDREVYADQVEF